MTGLGRQPKPLEDLLVRLESSSNLLSRRRSLGRAIDEWISGLAQFENPVRREVVRLVTGAAALTEINSIRQLNIGMALSTGASNHS
jgi:hypothetical protein